MNNFAVGDLLALDPSFVKPGVALFRGGKLIAAERVKIDPDYKSMPFAERCGRVASDIIRWGIAHKMRPRTYAYELPQFYSERDGKTVGDPNDLRGLIAIGAEIAGTLRLAMAGYDISLVVHSPTPAEWAGQIPKATTGDPWASPRGVRVKSRLSPAELLAVVPSHDAIDAVGIGLFIQGRFSPKHIYPGAV